MLTEKEFLDTVKEVLSHMNNPSWLATPKNTPNMGIRMDWTDPKNMVNTKEYLLITSWTTGEPAKSIPEYDRILLATTRHKDISFLEYKVMKEEIVEYSEESKNNSHYDDDSNRYIENYTTTYSKTINLSDLYHQLKKLNILVDYVEPKPAVKATQRKSKNSPKPS